MRLRELPDILIAGGVERVVVESGFSTRGSSSWAPEVLIEHHTGGSLRGGNAPSRVICRDGRAGLPGPLCQVLWARDGTAICIASGRANHAGAGSWMGVSGNTRSIGFEIENNGIGEPYSPHLLNEVRKGTVAVCRALGIQHALVCAHFEWAPTRKIDPGTPKWDMAAWRASLGQAGPIVLPTTPAPTQEDLMIKFVRDVKTGRVYVLNHATGKRTHIPNAAAYKTLGRLYGLPTKHENFLLVEIDAVSSEDTVTAAHWRKIWG